MQPQIFWIFDIPQIRFHYLNRGEPRKNKIPPLFREMGFGRPSAIRHPKGLWLMELWQGQVFKADTTKLRRNVKK
jgi:hypothetical protein